MKIQRNAPCPCGSGKKYKHCCLALDLQRNGAVTAEVDNSKTLRIIAVITAMIRKVFELSTSAVTAPFRCRSSAKQQCLYFLPLPQGHGAFRCIFISSASLHL